MPASLRIYLAATGVEVPPFRTATAALAEVGEDESIAVIRVDRDVLFAVDTGTGWSLEGAWVNGSSPWLGAQPIFLLVIGSDARPGENQQRLRADSIHVVAVAQDATGGTIVGFPRDSFISAEIIAAANETVGLAESALPSGSIKWTNLMARRGPEIMLATARELTGLPIAGYIVTGFKGFEDLIGAIGGIRIILPRSISTGNEEPDFASGRQFLNAARTLLLARIRKTIRGGDFSRSLNQGLIILAAMTMLQNRGIDSLPDLVDILLENTWTDLEAGELLRLAAAGLLIDPGELDNLVMPGAVRTINGASVVLLDEEELERVTADIAPDGLLD